MVHICIDTIRVCSTPCIRSFFFVVLVTTMFTWMELSGSDQNIYKTTNFVKRVSCILKFLAGFDFWHNYFLHGSESEIIYNGSLTVPTFLSCIIGWAWASFIFGGWMGGSFVWLKQTSCVNLCARGVPLWFNLFGGYCGFTVCLFVGIMGVCINYSGTQGWSRCSKQYYCTYTLDH